MRILLHFDVGHSLDAELAELAAGGLDIATCPEAADDDFAALLPEAEVIWHVLRPLGEADMAAAPKLRLIQKLGSGVNTIDLAAARARGIAVANMPGTNAQAVAEGALLLMLAALRATASIDARTRAGHGWPSTNELVGGELAGRTVGLVGGGEIARRLMPMLTAIGADVCFTSATPRDDPRWRGLDDLLTGSDVVSLHVPLTQTTRKLLNADRLAAMRPGSVLVNTARGDIVDEAALVHALTNGPLAAAGLDVFATEPATAGNPLFALPNVVVSPHISWLTMETWRRYFAVAADNVRRLEAGEELRFRVG